MFEKLKSNNVVGDFWGGLAAMLVALPSAIAFGVTIYASLGGSYAAYGAIAGIMGVAALGIIAPLLGGTNRLISAPCAPAAAVLSAFVIERIASGVPAEIVLVMVTLLALISGIIQVAFGAVGLGKLIKFMPYPVVSGYLSGVGLYIIASQAPKFLGAPKGTHFWDGLLHLEFWKWQSISVGIVTIAAMILAPKITKKVPAVIIALLIGVSSYFVAGLFDPALLEKVSNPLIVGPLSSGGGSLFDSLSQRFHALGGFALSDVTLLIMPALTLAVLLSIDTLKTCVVLDALTHSRHESNKELVGQGCANVCASLIGGVPGAGTMGATLVNISSGADSRLSGVMEGVLAIAAFVLLSSLIAWVPIASLAGILIVIGFRMIDKHSFGFLKKRSTILDFVVIASVVVTALTVSLIAASGVGVALAVLLFIRNQITTSIVHIKSYGNETFSKQIRVQEEMDILQEKGSALAIYELQGSLFFGTANQLYSEVDEDIKTKKYIILDMRRVQSVDLTAAHILEQVRDVLGEHGGRLIFSRIPKSLPSGQDVQNYLGEVGLVKSQAENMIFDDLDDAIEWVENKIIEEARVSKPDEHVLALEEFELFKGRKEDTLNALVASLTSKSYQAGERIFTGGDTGDEIYLIRKGAVRIVLSLANSQNYHLSTFGKGNFFGEMAFLDGVARSADAIADSDTELFILSRATFDAFANDHKKAGLQFLEGIASVLASRLRVTNAELRALDS
jgi:sulfate permease, SulP family